MAFPDTYSFNVEWGDRGRKMLGASISPAEGGVQVDGKMGTDDLPATQNLDFRRCIAFIGGTYFLIMTTFIIPVACFASCVIFLFPLMFINMNLFNKLEQRLCRLVNDHWVTTAYYCGVQVREYGTDVSRFIESKCLYLANHLGLVDHFVVMTSLHNRGNVSGSWMWVIYNIWKFTPLGAMWTLHGNFFVNGGPNRKAALLETFKKHLKNFFTKHNYSWIIMYPEGSRLYLIRESGASFAKKNGLQPLQHCTYPRTGAAHAVLEVLGPQKDSEVARKGSGEPVKYIIDATLGYPKGQVVDIGSTIMGDFPLNDPSISIHYDVIPVKPEWANEEKLQEFLYERYRRKDELLNEFYKTGQFPGESRGTVQVNGWLMLRSQVFWMGSYYLHHILWIKPLWTFVVACLYSMIF